MIGTVLANRYEIVRELGRGGMGIVYLARDTVLEREVAVKMLPPALLSPEAEERFRREARVVGRMDHPGIIPLHDFAKHGESVFLVMPFVQGSSLRKLIVERSVSIRDAIEIGIRVAEALEHSHGLGVIHRDIKPENVMVDRDEDGTLRVRVADFGVASAEFEERVTKSGIIVGTGSYLSPEQVSESPIDARSDLFALGVLLYETLTGSLPFSGSGASLYYRIAFSTPRSIRTFTPEVSTDLDAIVLQCLEKSPDRRPSSARQLAASLRTLLPGSSDGIRAQTIQSTPAQGSGASPFGRTAFVNREREFAALIDRLTRASAGEAHFALVSGAAGIGKTRLLDELDAAARSRAIRVLHGRFDDRDQTFPFQGFCDAIQEYFVSEALTAAGAPTDLSDLLPELSTLFPALGELSSAKTTAASFDSSSSQPSGPRAFVERTEVFELLARTIIRIGAGLPLVLLLEDLHASDGSVEALQYVVRRCSATPTLFVATSRNEHVGSNHALTAMLESMRGDRRFELVTVGPLDASAHRELVANLIGSESIDAGLFDRLYEITEGNPYFTSELVRSLLESGDISESGDSGWHVTSSAGITPESLPLTIQQAVEERIRRLTDAQREVLSSAAVLGRTFSFRDLEMLVDESQDLERIVDWLVDTGFLSEERESRGDRLIFTSGIVRDALYAGLARRRRRSLHREVGQRLERRNATQIDRVLPDLVHHFAQGDVPEKVIGYGMTLARRALGAYSPLEARRTLETVLEFIGSSSPDSPSIEAEARDLLARALWTAGLRGPALDEYHRAIAGFRAAADPAREMTSIASAAEAAWAARFADTSAMLVDRGLELSRESVAAGDSENPANEVVVSNLARLLKLGATIANLRGEFELAAQRLDERERLLAFDASSRIEVDRGATLRIAVPPTIRARHPIQCRTRGDIESLAAAFETLLLTDSNGVIVPNLVERWEMLEEGRLFLLQLREDIQAHDGRIVAAESVREAFEYAIRHCTGELPLAFAQLARVAAFRSGEDERLTALAADGLTLSVHLDVPLPIFPSLLTDVRTALALPSGDSSDEVVGTGPFSIRSVDEDRITLSRNPQPWRGAPANVAAIEIVGNLTGEEIARHASSGESDIVRGVPGLELEELLRDRRRRHRLVEAPGANVWFLLFHQNRPGGASVELRRAMCGILAFHDVVRTTIGRFAVPAEGLIPPGIFGHDPNRRSPAASHEQIREWLAASAPHSKLTALASFGFQHRHQKLVETMLSLWSDYGIDVVLRDASDTDERAYEQTVDEADIYFGGWAGDYLDPDAFTYALFHSESGLFRRIFASAALDPLFEAARLESRPAAREELYRHIEDRLQAEAAVLPLFHENEYRLASHRVHRLVLQSGAPFMNFESVGKTPAPTASSRRGRGGGRINVPVPVGCDLRTLDPSVIRMDLESEVLGTVFEPLLRNPDGARVIPWLAKSYDVEDGGRRIRFTLRDDVIFHNGRSLTARDVRFSFERVMRNPDSVFRWHLAPIRGATAMLNGSGNELEGFRILSRLEFTIELDYPVAFFPSLLTDPAVAIVPEGSSPQSGVWRDAAVGTGPFHVVRFQPGERLELGANLTYWREGLPRADELVFTFGNTPQMTADSFRSGRASIAWNLLPEDEASLRTDPAVAASYSEAPGLQTVILAFNTHRGPLADEAIRQHIVSSLDVEAIVRRAAGPYAAVASGIVPPGLIGHSGSLRTTGSAIRPAPLARDIELSCLMRPLYSEGSEAALREELFKALAAIGVRARIHCPPRDQWEAARAAAVDDMFLFGWIADYPDADSFIHGLLRTERGWIGRFCGSPDLDRLIDRSRTAVDPELRHDLYREIEAVVARRALLQPIVHSRSYRYVRPEVRGLEVTLALPYVAYEKMWIDSSR